MLFLYSHPLSGSLVNWNLSMPHNILNKVKAKDEKADLILQLKRIQLIMVLKTQVSDWTVFI
jgi:hypothetical protein